MKAPMLNKENLLVRSSPVNEWRKLYVGKLLTGNIDDRYDVYGYNKNSYGSLSDIFVNEREITTIGSLIYRDSGRVITSVTFDHLATSPKYTLYLKRKDKETIELLDIHGGGQNYDTYDVAYFTKDDWGNTIDIYIGFTPPLKRKIKRTPRSRRVLSC